VYHYHTNCVNSTAKLIDDMTDDAIDITYRTMFKHCPGLLDWAVGVGYERDSRRGLTLKNDYCVSYHRSNYGGLRCYYVCWSAIEYIFIAAEVA